MKSELYKRGYKWAFDFNEFDSGALEAVRDMQNTENKT
ncbi:hypothetical protein FDI46_gp131 [Aeromonas phage AS-gz]|uniref:Uncharacterized protein n=1 Tax=Aeromonas phage AS-gz TaxID=2026082 RepID=A0A223LEG5_9CAUD|nr:hypothetical protein FDI46_gp131 [Aeromonas phage AS-gz]ASU00667.1 hypothetical protein [Aeromonas phage AS-gz]